MDKKFWKNIEFSEGNEMQLDCSRCDSGKLELKEITFSETRDSNTLRDHPEWEPSWIEYRFNGVMKCSNKYCLDETHLVGKGCEVEYFDDEGQPIDRQIIYTPLYFVPPIKLFPIPKNTAINIKTELIKAFSLFWCDIDACANKIRSTVELLMDEYRISRTHINKRTKKRIPTSLHTRIEKFKSSKPKLEKYAKRLLAVKWIGNEGTHPGALTRADVVNAFDLLETCIEKTYEDREAELDRLANQINRDGGKKKMKKIGIRGSIKKKI